MLIDGVNSLQNHTMRLPEHFAQTISKIARGDEFIFCDKSDKVSYNLHSFVFEGVDSFTDNENGWNDSHVDAFGSSFNRSQPKSSSSYLVTEDFIQEFNEFTAFNNDIGRVDPEFQDTFESETEKLVAKSREAHFYKH